MSWSRTSLGGYRLMMVEKSCCSWHGKETRGHISIVNGLNRVWPVCKFHFCKNILHFRIQCWKRIYCCSPNNVYISPCWAAKTFSCDCQSESYLVSPVLTNLGRWKTAYVRTDVRLDQSKKAKQRAYNGGKSPKLDCGNTGDQDTVIL